MPGGPVASPEVQFLTSVSKQTGIDPRVIQAWMQQEGAYAPGGTGNFNYLNLRPYPGDPYSGVSSGDFEQFSSVADAIAATVARLKQPFAAPILAAAGKTPSAQIAAIASTGWDSGHYGGMGGINLKNTFARLFGVKALTSKGEGAGAVQTTHLPGDKGVPNPLDWVSGLTGWVQRKAAYGAVYALLVLFALFLGVIGVLAMLGIKPGTVVAGSRMEAAA